MAPRIAIPMPHSTDREYGERAIPQYERAVALVGGEPVRIPLDRSNADLRSLIGQCDGVLLPGSNADVDPSRFHQYKSQHTAAADRRREEVDDLLLRDAYAQRKPVLGICYGLQSLNVYRKGSLVQNIPDFLPEETRSKVNHEAGKTVAVAHAVTVEQNSVLGQILCGDRRFWLLGRAQPGDGLQPQNDREEHGFSRADTAVQANRPSAAEAGSLILPVNSSHHQSADVIGN